MKKAEASRFAMKLKDSEVKHLRHMLAWMRVEYCLDEDMQRGALGAVKAMMDAGDITQDEAERAIAKRADQIKQVPEYIRHGIKMLTKALRSHEGVKGDVVDVDQMRVVHEIEQSAGVIPD